MKARKRLAAELDIEHFIRSLRLSRNLLNHTSKREKRLIAMQADRNVIRVLPIEFDYLLKDVEDKVARRFVEDSSPFDSEDFLPYI